MPDNYNEFKKRNLLLVERLRTPAAPRIKEAAARRRVLLDAGVGPRECAREIARQMGDLTPRSVRNYLRAYDADPAQYDGITVTLTWKK